MNLTDLLTEGAYESRVWIDDVLLQDIGIAVLLNSDEPALPALRNTVVNVPGRHGAYDFGAYLEPREFTLNCVFPRQSYSDLKRHIREFNQLFIDEYGRPKTVKLRFGDEVDKYYNVRLTGGIPVERAAERGLITVKLTAFDPYAYSLVNANEVTWGSEVVTFEWSYLLGTESTGSFEWFNPNHYVNALNYSHFATPLNLVIEGEVHNPEITINGKVFTLTTSVYEDERLYVDSKTMQVWKVKTFEDFHGFLTPVMMSQSSTERGRVNLFKEVKGDFPHLSSGENHIKFEGNSPNAFVKLSWQQRFL